MWKGAEREGRRGIIGGVGKGADREGRREGWGRGHIGREEGEGSGGVGKGADREGMKGRGGEENR